MLFYQNDISFRKVEEKDLQNLLDLKNESWFGTHAVTIANLSDQKRWFNSLDSDIHTPKDLFLIAVCQEEIGTFKFKIDWFNRRADVGWDIFLKHRGKGLGKKLVVAGINFAKEFLFLHRITAEILETNKISQKCAINAGFVLEGTKKSEILKQNVYVDNLIYGLLLDK